MDECLCSALRWLRRHAASYVQPQYNRKLGWQRCKQCNVVAGDAYEAVQTGLDERPNAAAQQLVLPLYARWRMLDGDAHTGGDR